MFLSYVDLTPT